MFSRLVEYLIEIMPITAIDDDKELQSYIGLAATGYASILTHVILLAVFIVQRNFWQIILNIASLLLTVTALLANKHKKFLFSGLIITFDVITYTLVSVFFFGNANYTFLYFFALMVVQLVIQYSDQFIRRLLILVIWAIMLFSLHLDGRDQSSIFAYIDQNTLLKFVNISITVFSVVCAVSLGNVINSLIAAVNDKKINDLIDQAQTDPLTELFNRRYAEQLFENISRDTSKKQWCIAMLDIDNFKVINDTLGHNIGDKILSNLAIFVKNKLRKTDILIRWGGEEFLIMLENVDLNTAFSIIEKLRIVISKEEIISVPRPVYLTVTAGISVVDKADILESINSCDKKLYEGKQIGKNISII